MDRAGAREDEEHSPGLSTGDSSGITSPAPAAPIPSGARARIEANLSALCLARELQADEREPGEADLAVLRGWTSWGAVPGVFDATDDRFQTEREQLRELLTQSEYNAASRTVLNAHYTQGEYVWPMWDTLLEMGFTGGQVLEPGCGAGSFIAQAPNRADDPRLSSDVRMTGVELDPSTALIAQHLHPDARIRAESFADSPFADNTFDAVIGNVPFGKVALHDPKHNAGKHSLHNHFILKSLDLTRPGGVVAVLTSRYTLDAQSSAAREAMYERADLVGAVRLPSGAHRRLAGTEAVTDLVVLRKRLEGEQPRDDSWVHTTTIDLTDRDGDLVPTRVNQWWEDHPEAVLGTMRLDHGMFNAQTLTVRANSLGELEGDFVAATRALAQRAEAEGLTWVPASQDAPMIDADAVIEPVARTGDISTFHGHIAWDGEQFTRLTMGTREAFEVPASQQRQLRELLTLRDTVVQLLDAEAASMEDTEEISTLRAQLNTRYDNYVGRFGPVNTVKVSETSRLDKQGNPIVSRRYPPVMKTFRTDPHRTVVSALEHYDEKTGTASKAAIFTERVISPRVVPTRADSPADALAIVWDERREVDLDRIGALLDVSATEAREQLGSLVFDDPMTNSLVPAAEYLSGNVRQKLAAVEAEVSGRPELEVNAAALREVMPRDLGPEEITARLGAIWVPREDVEQFLRETLDDPSVRLGHGGGSMWKIEGGSKVSQKAVSEWGTERMNALAIAEKLLTQSSVLVHDTERTPEGGERRVLNPQETEAAKAKAEALQDAFGQWVWAEPERSMRLSTAYNELFNSFVLRDYTAAGERLTLPGLVGTFNPHPHQRSAVARIVSEPSVGLYHGVGAGKTAEMVMGATELRRLGLVSKPAVIVPNHMLEQVAREWLELYPQANILAAGSEDLRGEGRQEFVAKAATGQWDGIIMTQGAFGSLDVSRSVRAEYRDRVVQDYRLQLEALQATGGRSMTTKRMEAAIERLEERMTAKLDMKKDPGLTFEQTGIDYLLVDELHMYKNKTVVSNIEGVGVEGSLRATDLDMKIGYLRQRAQESGRNPRVITGATATPIANSMAEAYIMQTYLRPDLLEQAGLTDFDSWAATFGESVTELEMAPEGGGFRSKTRFAKFNNLPELLRMWHISADVKTSADLQLNVPDLVERADGQRLAETVIVPASVEMGDFMQTLADRAEDVRARRVEPQVDNMLKISSDGRKAALDLRMLNPEQRPVEDMSLMPAMTKLDVAANRIHEIWQANRDRTFLDAAGEPHARPGGFQIVFSDLGTPNDGWSAYGQLRDNLVAKGMDPARIAFVHDANTDQKKERLFAECRTGGIDVLIGSTAKMGVGTNIQTRATALHHLDCPWRPADVEQREGRIIRQGNQNEQVQILRYATEGSFDAYMWQTVERKGKFIDQVMHGDLTTREAEDISSDQSLSFNEVKALASGNPLLLEKAQADQELAKLQNLEKAHRASQVAARGALDRSQSVLSGLETRIPRLQEAISQASSTKGDDFRLTVPQTGQVFTDRVEASNAIRGRLMEASAKARAYSGETIPVDDVARVGGLTFDAAIKNTLGSTTARIYIRGLSSDVFQQQELNTLIGQADSYGLVTRLENMVTATTTALEKAEGQREQAIKDGASAQEAVGKPFARADDLQAARERVNDLAQQLSGEDSPDLGVTEGQSTPDALPVVVDETPQDEINRRGRAQLDQTLTTLRERRDSQTERDAPSVASTPQQETNQGRFKVQAEAPVQITGPGRERFHNVLEQLREKQGRGEPSRGFSHRHDDPKHDRGGPTLSM